jgi:hypothetical protein
MALFSKKSKITIHAFTRLLAQCIIKANPINYQIIEESESLSGKEKEKIVSELLYFRLVLLYFMLVFEGKFGGKHYDDSELIDIIHLGVCLAFEDDGIDKEDAQQRTEIFMQRLLHYTTSTIGTSEDSVEIKEDEIYCELVQHFRDDILGVEKDKLVKMLEDEEFMLKHHEVFHYTKQLYDHDDNMFKQNFKEYKFVN